MMRGIQVELPSCATEKLDELQIRRDNALTLSHAAQSKINMLDGRNGGHLLEKLTTDRDLWARAHNELHRLQSAIHQYLFELRLPVGYVLASAPVAVELEKGQTPAEALTKVRNEIAAINQQIVAVRRAPLKKSSQQDAVRAYLARLVERVRPTVGFDARGNGRVLWREEMVVNKDEVLGLIVWALGPLGPQELLSAFELDQQPEPPNAISPEEREQNLHDLSSALLSAERRESAVLELTDVLPRAEMSALSYLQIAIVAKEVAATVAA
jgi:hypothetical protein